MSVSTTGIGSDLRERLRFETMLSDLSCRFVNLPPGEVDWEIEDAQRRVCECIGLDLSSLWQWTDGDPGLLTLTHIYRTVEDPPMPDVMRAEESFPWCQERLLKGEVISASSLVEMPPEAARDREMCEHFGIRSFCTFPLAVGDESPVGAISFNTLHEEIDWTDEIVQRLGIVAEVFANALDRVRSDSEIRDSEEKLELAADSADLGMWMLDAESGRFWANELGRALFGYPPDAEITMRVFVDSLHLEDRDRVTAAVETAIRTEGEIDVEYRIHLPDGGLRWIRSRGRAQPASTRTATRLLGASLDVTARRRAEIEVADQLRFESLLSDLSARFVKMASDEVDDAIERALGEFGESYGCDRCGLLRVETDPPSMHVEHAWYRQGIPEVPSKINLVESFPWSYQRLVLDGEPICCEGASDLPEEARQDLKSIDEMGIRSFSWVPLTAADGVRWLMTAATLRGERVWPKGFSSRQLLLGEVFLNALERKRTDEKLQHTCAEVRRLSRQLELENAYLKREHSLKYRSGRIVGESPSLLEVLSLAEQVAQGKTTVLVEGATGTGKELIAQRIHELSPRGERPMVKVNCAALPSTLVESELFGREKGAYTGAVSREPGRFEVANGSTLFLDEISELPLELQAKLLRVLEAGEYERVGSSRTLHTDVRVIAATNRDLQAEVEAGRFRRDLYFRLAVFPIRVPPLTDRRGDIPLLVWSVVEEFSAAMHKSVESISRSDLERLQRHDWPGNVRELRNVVERAMIMCSGPELRIEIPDGSRSDNGPLLSLDEAQRRQIAKAMDAADGRISGAGGAAELLGLKPTTLRSKMDRLGMDPRRRSDGDSSS